MFEGNAVIHKILGVHVQGHSVVFVLGSGDKISVPISEFLGGCGKRKERFDC